MRHVCVLAVAAMVFGAAGVTSQMTAAARGPRRSLAAEARFTASHGGVYSHGYGAATARMKQLTASLIVQRFGASSSRALCFARRESGLNPVAVSATDDHGAFQVNRPTHPQFDYWRMDHDPAYGVWAGWVVSSRGRDWSPWNGGSYAC